MFSEKAAAEIADGAAFEWIERMTAVVERARHLQGRRRIRGDTVESH